MAFKDWFDYQDGKFDEPLNEEGISIDWMSGKGNKMNEQNFEQLAEINKEFPKLPKALDRREEKPKEETVEDKETESLTVEEIK